MIEYLPADYNQPIRACVFISLAYQITGWLVTRARATHFSKEFMKKEFGSEHLSSVKSEVVEGGYPDCGDGRYAQKLSFGQWHSFNQAVRGYLNFSEWIVASLLGTLLSGLFYPTYGAYLGYAIALGRLMYSLGYLISPDKRMGGAVLSELPILAQFVMTGIGLYYSK